MPRGVPSGSSLKIAALDLQAIKMQLKKMKPKEKESYDKKEAILFLKEAIEDLLQKNYSWKDISEMLTERKIPIPASTIKRWIEEDVPDIKNRKRCFKEPEDAADDEPNEAVKEPENTAGEALHKAANEPEDAAGDEPNEAVKEPEKKSAAHFTIEEDTEL